jgi:hypothetical protein
MSNGMYTVVSMTMARKASAEKYLPRMISWSFTGDDVSSTIVPICFSSASSRIEKKIVAVMNTPLE